MVNITRYLGTTPGGDSLASIICLGKVTPDNAVIIGHFKFLGIAGGWADISFQNTSMLATLFADLRYNFHEYQYTNPAIKIIKYTYAGDNYYGMVFESNSTAYLPTGFQFDGQISNQPYIFAEHLIASSVIIGDVKRGGVDTHVATGSGAPTSIPNKAGLFYVDKINRRLYFSVDHLSAADWQVEVGGLPLNDERYANDAQAAANGVPLLGWYVSPSGNLRRRLS